MGKFAKSTFVHFGCASQEDQLEVNFPICMFFLSISLYLTWEVKVRDF